MRLETPTTWQCRIAFDFNLFPRRKRSGHRFRRTTNLEPEQDSYNLENRENVMMIDDHWCVHDLVVTALVLAVLEILHGLGPAVEQYFPLFRYTTCFMRANFLYLIQKKDTRIGKLFLLPCRNCLQHPANSTCQHLPEVLSFSSSQPQMGHERYPKWTTPPRIA